MQCLLPGDNGRHPAPLGPLFLEKDWRNAYD